MASEKGAGNGVPKTDIERLKEHFGEDWEKYTVEDLPPRGSNLNKASNNLDFLKAFLETIRNIVDRDVYRKIFNYARAYAGGKARKKNPELELAKAALSLYQEVSDDYFVAEIKKSSDEKQIVYGVILEPMTNVTPEGDLHGHSMTAEEVEKTAHGYIEKYQTIGLQHAKAIDARVVESYIAPEDMYEGMIKKGSWVMAVHVLKKDIWNKIKKGEINAFSPGGFGKLKDIDTVS